MIPARFDYEVAESVDHALELLRSREDVKLLAGGHSLVPLLKLRVVEPALLVDLGRLKGDLAYVRDEGAEIAVGALTRHHDLVGSPVLRSGCGLLSATAGTIGDPQVRHRGTIGGSVSHGDPASDLPAALLALGATFVLRGPGGERRVPAADFFTGIFQTALGADELLAEIRVPTLAAEHGYAYVKFNRRAQDWATVGVAAVVRWLDGAPASASIALTSMGATPLRAKAAEDAIGDGIAAAAAAAASGTSPPSDTNGSADYRRHLATVLTRRALEQARPR